MSKELSEMTLEELWQLFPIIIREHDIKWNDQYNEEERFLINILPDNAIISHIGSTAINGICAKPIVDILVESEISDFSEIKRSLLKHDYLCYAEDEKSIDFNKGYTKEGFAAKVFHLHLREYGDNRELYFRDYMNDNPDIAKEYEKLKISLSKRYEHDRDAYTNAKTDFIKKYTDEAICRYGQRYSRASVCRNMEQKLIFEDRGGNDKDFIYLCGELDKALEELVGGKFQRNVYAKYNTTEMIHDAIVVYDGENPVACGSFKRYDDEHAELKRVFVSKDIASHGLGSQIVGRLEDKARQQGYRYCILETGVPLKAACHMYQKLGYKVIPNYGQYADMSNSICMEKEL